jgi:hypothetical protein
MRRLSATLFAMLLLAALSASSESHATAVLSITRTGAVETITAVLPAADDVGRFKPILLAADAKTCPEVTSGRLAVFRRHHVSRPDGGQSQLIDIGCATGRARVRVIYAAVTVPNLVGSLAHQARDVTSMLGLRLKIITKLAESGQLGGHVLGQRPAPGSVVRFGTTLVLVAAAVT